jgi:hypothetical protein
LSRRLHNVECMYTGYQPYSTAGGWDKLTVL